MLKIRSHDKRCWTRSAGSYATSVSQISKAEKRNRMTLPLDLEPSIGDAIISAREFGITDVRTAADQSLGPLTDESWSKMKDEWERHWALPAETLAILREKHFQK